MTRPSINHCLVTGASGFIGRVLCESLRNRGLYVRATARREVDGPWDAFVAADLARLEISTDVFADLMHGIDTVFHLAGKAHALAELAADEEVYRQVNIGSTRNLLSMAAKHAPARFVFFSSVKAADDDNDGCMDESWDAPPTTPYGMSKRESERLVMEAGRERDMHVSVLRLPLVYGRGAKGNLWKMMDAVSRGRFPPVPETGNRRSMVHVEDAVRAAMLAAEVPQANGRQYIVTDGDTYSTRTIYTLMCEALGKPARAWAVPASVLRGMAAAGDVIGRIRGRRFVFDSDAYRKLLGSACYDSSRIERELGFEPVHNLRDGVAEMAVDLRRSDGGGLGASVV